MRHPKRLAGGPHEGAFQRLFGRKGHGMQHEVQCAAKLFTHLIEHAVDMVVLRHVALGDQRVVTEGLSQLRHVIFEPLALIGECQLRAFFLPRFRNRPRDRSLVGHTKHHAFFAG